MRRVRRRFWILLLAAGPVGWLITEGVQQVHAEPSYALIEDGLYLGCRVKAPPPGTTAVVNLCGAEDPYKREAGFWEPILEGGPEPDLAWLERAVGFIAEQRRRGRTVYVHCLAGVNRSAMLTTAYLMQEQGWPRDRALAFVREKRPQASPEPSMLKLLQGYEERLKARK
ncbi:MAG: dual specificity protein phosphatase family protein [Planctomycetes bacterium]|nr:dual specificity protein phosphatase family protein [Planctomycetota bacterium]